MDYEKKYKDILSLAKSYKDNNLKEFLDLVFPELNMSEDERIRKELIKLLKFLPEGIAENYTAVSLKDFVAYLENQKDQKLLLPEDKVKCPLYVEGFEVGKEVGRQCEKVFGKQKEQKLTEKQDYTGLTDLERSIHRGFLSAGVENVPVTTIKEMAQECLAHIDKPAEWSEEDEFHLKWLCRIVHARRVEGEISLKEESELGRWMDKWLNHNPQPRWKPSEEEMQALSWAINYFADIEHVCASGLALLKFNLKEML